jgi:hypothetical protein
VTQCQGAESVLSDVKAMAAEGSTAILNQPDDTLPIHVFDSSWFFLSSK